MRTKIVWLGLLLSLCLQPSARAEYDIGGYLGTIIKWYSGFMGKTDVTPQGALSYWRNRYWGNYAGSLYDIQRSITRASFTGALFYSTASYNQFSGTYTYNSSPFPVNSPKVFNYNCDATDYRQIVPVYFIFHEEEFYQLAIWVAGVKKTGYFPPGAPYPCWLKSYATRVAETCYSIWPSTTEVRAGCSLYDSGQTLVSQSPSGNQFTFPPLLWVGGAYDY